MRAHRGHRAGAGKGALINRMPEQPGDVPLPMPIFPRRSACSVTIRHQDQRRHTEVCGVVSARAKRTDVGLVYSQGPNMPMPFGVDLLRGLMRIPSVNPARQSPGVGPEKPERAGMRAVLWRGSCGGWGARGNCRRWLPGRHERDGTFSHGGAPGKKRSSSLPTRHGQHRSE